MTDMSGESGDVAAERQTLTRQIIEVVKAPAAMALAAMLLGILSLLSLTPADDIGQLDTSDALGIGVSLPGEHAQQISVGVRFAVSALALRLAIAAVRRLRERPLAAGDVQRAAWTDTIAGAAVLVALVAFVLNLVAFAVVLAHGSSLYSVYNHIGS